MKIAIVGATGVVGSTAIQILEERLHPKENIFPLASKRSNGKKNDAAQILGWGRNTLSKKMKEHGI